MIRAVALFVVVVAGCKGEKPAAPDAAKGATAAATSGGRGTSQANPPRDGGAVDASRLGAAPPPGGGDKVGVAECDEYLDKMARCIEKLSPDSAAPMRAAMEDSRKAWQQTAATDQGRKALTDACRS